jgi:two-component system sensor histidine kinase KdpD
MMPFNASRWVLNASSYVVSVAAVAMLAVLILALGPTLSTSDKTMLFLLPVLWSAARYGKGPAIVTAVFGAATCNFFFFEPAFSFGVYSFHDAITFAIYVVTAIVISNLVAKMQAETRLHREQAEHAGQLSDQLDLLLDLGVKITVATSREEVAANVAAVFEERLGMVVNIEYAAQTELGSTATAIPLVTKTGSVGFLVIGVASVSKEVRPMLDAAARLTALAIERLDLFSKVEDAKLMAMADNMRATFLASMTHDLNTPLAAVIGSASSLLTLNDASRPETVRQLASTCLQGARRLDRYIRNILDLTSIESGALKLDRRWVDVDDVIGSALTAAEYAIADRPVTVDLPNESFPINVDFILIERVLVNLLENAGKFGSANGKIEISAARGEGNLEIRVFNEGPQISPANAERLFERFFRANNSGSDGRRLGLSICRGIMEIHGGKVRAESQSGGTAFVLSFPIGTPPSAIVPEDE